MRGVVRDDRGSALDRLRWRASYTGVRALHTRLRHLRSKGIGWRFWSSHGYLSHGPITPASRAQPPSFAATRGSPGESAGATAVRIPKGSVGSRLRSPDINALSRPTDWPAERMFGTTKPRVAERPITRHISQLLTHGYRKRNGLTKTECLNVTYDSWASIATSEDLRISLRTRGRTGLRVHVRRTR